MKKQIPNCYDLALQSGIIGMIKDGPSDLSTNPKYFAGFGESNPKPTKRGRKRRARQARR